MLRDEARRLRMAYQPAYEAALGVRSAMLLGAKGAGAVALLAATLLAYYRFEADTGLALAVGIGAAAIVAILALPLLQSTLRWLRRTRLEASAEMSRKIFEHLSALRLLPLLRLRSVARDWQNDLESIERTAVELTQRSNDIFIDPSGRDVPKPAS
jgi:hypothetical protein